MRCAVPALDTSKLLVTIPCVKPIDPIHWHTLQHYIKLFFLSFGAGPVDQSRDPHQGMGFVLPYDIRASLLLAHASMTKNTTKTPLKPAVLGGF